MQCPKCHFAHEAQHTECFKCGIVFAKYERYQASLKALPVYIDDIDEKRRASTTLEAARQELTWRWLALPIALVVARLLVASPLAPFVRVFFSMWVHESGHAITAWLCGFGAFPGPWFTPISAGRLPLVSVVLATGLCWGVWRAWYKERWLQVAGWSAVLVLQLIGTTLPLPTAYAMIIFGGDAGCLVLGSLLMATFYARRESTLYREALRWGFLIIGAAAFMDAFATWWGARSNLDRIPFGKNEGVGLSDPSRLIEEYSWAYQAMIGRYVWLSIICLVILAVLYARGVLRARTAVQMYPDA